MSDIIQSVDRALEILIYLCHQGGETGITQIAADLGVYKSTVYRTLYTLEARGFVRKNPETEKYWLGSRLFTLGKSVENRMGLRECIRPYARKLRDAYREAVNVSILERNAGDLYHSVILLKEESGRRTPTATPPVGSSLPCHRTSAGKCLLAFSKDVDLSVYDNGRLCSAAGRAAATLPSLQAELARVRERGCAMDREELEPGLACIGAPILDRAGFAVAAISLSGPTGRMLGGDVEERVAAVRRAAGEISSRLCDPAEDV